MQNHEALADAEMMGFFIVAAVIGIIVLAMFVFYLLSLQKALARCSEENRTMAPGMVWLSVIPCFGLGWNFFVVINLAKSLGAELRQRGIAGPEDPGKVDGLIMAVSAVLSLVPFVGPLAGLVVIVSWIIHWIQIAGVSKLIADPPEAPPEDRTA